MGIWECDIKVKVWMGIDFVEIVKGGFEWWVVNSNNDVNIYNIEVFCGNLCF